MLSAQGTNGSQRPGRENSIWWPWRLAREGFSRLGKRGLALALFVSALGLLAGVVLIAGPTAAETDGDGDGFTNAAEAFMGTDPLRGCNETTSANDEEIDAWPPDFNDDRKVDQADVDLLHGVFGSTTGSSAYSPRFDLTSDGKINILDSLRLRAVYGSACEPTPPPPPATSFLATFDGDPPAPQSMYNMPGWDTTVDVRGDDPLKAIEMRAMHGPNCEAPGPGSVHPVEGFNDQIFRCRNHVMTAINGPQGQIFLTPAAMIDFSQDEAVIRFDGSSLVTSNRDWRTIWIQPWDTNLANPQSQGPKEAVFWNTSNNTLRVYDNYSFVKQTGIIGFQKALAKLGLAPSATRRDTYEIHISTTRFQVTLITANGSMMLTDVAIDPPLTWTRGIVQFGHQTYSPGKGTTDDDCAAFGLTCPGPNTWHWDNVSIDPPIPFTIIHGTTNNGRYVDGGYNTPLRMDFAAPAPANSWLRFQPMKANINKGGTVDVSFDGVNWEPARLQPKGKTNEKWTVWHPIPEGTETVWVRGKVGRFFAVDFSIWSRTVTTSP
ncbi:MAG: dockerin type I domain-containing protein [Anaerolineae bacterium]